MENNRDFKVLTDREHVLCRPGMYLGQVALTEKEMWLYNKDENKFHFGKIRYVPALLKYISELLDNSIDVAIDTNFKYATKIQINIDKKSVEVIDDGIGIPCKAPDGSDDKSANGTCVVAAWTKLKSGTSFSDNRNKIGTNGVGASCSNIFSKVFIGHSDDGKHSQTIECKDNMSSVKAKPIKPSCGKSGVRVYCEPDLQRFNLTEITDEHINLVYQRLVSLAISYPKIKFYFNKQQVKVNEKKFAEMFSNDFIIESSDNATIVAFPNEYDEFRSFSLVNGIETFRGGEHVDFISYEVSSRIRDKLIKKFKNIRPGDIKNKMCLAIILTSFANPQFDAQTKESLSNSASEVNKHLAGNIDFDEFAKKILKNAAIIDPIVDMFKLKEELKARQELKGVKRVKVKSDKYMKPEDGSGKKYLALCEGASAMSGISGSLGRKGIGYYAMRGLPLNAYSSTVQKIAANQELKDIVNILNLDISKAGEEKKTIEFDKILITTDADADGSHITAMLIGWFKRFAPNLFDEGKLCKLVTPLIIVENSKGEILHHFMNVPQFKEWEKKNPNNKNKIVYLKGLGSWERQQLIDLIAKNSIETFIQEYKLDDKGNTYIEDWLGDDPTKRKEYLREYSFDINQA